MGLIIIETRGSFGSHYMTFSAMDNGHAHAVNKAMIWLNEIMRQGINNDHQCHDEGVKPEKGFKIND